MSTVATRTEKCFYDFDEFRVDPVRRRLLRAGEPVALTPKAFSILLILLEKRGDIVEKEDLIQKVWPDTFVTEANVTQNISSLRKALGERANDPRYVVTVPGRGYTFVADVFESPREATAEFILPVLPPSLQPPTPTSLEVLPREPEPGSLRSVEPPLPPLPAKRTARRLLSWGAGALLLLAVLVGAFFLLRDRIPSSPPQGPLAPEASSGLARSRPSVAVLGLWNLSEESGHSWLGTAMAEMLTTELETGEVRVVSGENVSRARQSLGLLNIESLDTDDLTKLHNLLGADFIVAGSYVALGPRGGDRVRLDLRVLDVTKAEPVASLAEVGTEGELFDLVSRTGTRLRRSLGWGDPSPDQTRAVQALLPANPEATRLYTEGLAHLRSYDFKRACELLEAAAKADPESAVVHSALSSAWRDLGEDSRAAAAAEEALRLAAPLPKKDRLAIEARYHETVREWDKASELYRSLWTFYPDDLEYGLRLAQGLSEGGHSREAMATVASLRKFPLPEAADPRIDLTEAEIAKRTSDFERASKAAEAAVAKGRRYGASQIVAQALVLQGDALVLTSRSGEALPLYSEARERFAKAGNHASLAIALTHTGVALQEQSELAAAEEAYEAALAIADRLGSSSLIAGQLGNLGLLRRDQGDLASARKLLEEALGHYGKTEDRILEMRTRYFLAMVRASQGDLAESRSELEQVVELSREAGSRTDEARSLSGLGSILQWQGALTEARRLEENALTLARPLNDPMRAASIQAVAALVAADRGHLAQAQQELQQALATQRRSGNRLSLAQTLGSLAEVAYRRGDLGLARTASLEQLRFADATRARLVAAGARRSLGRIALAAGDVAAARKHLEESLRLGAGDEIGTAATKLDQARLALLAGDTRDAVRLARAVAPWYGTRQMYGHQAQALALAAQGLARQDQRREAKEAAEEARSLAERTENREQRILVTTGVAQADAASGSLPAAIGHVRWAISEAGQTGFVTAGLEARLALGTLQLAHGDTAGRETLLAVRKEAQQKGFAFIAHRAAAALDAPRTSPAQPRLG